jgi:hypothetical protein
MKAIAIVNNSASKLSAESHTLSSSGLLLVSHGSKSPSGVRSK